MIEFLYFSCGGFFSGKYTLQLERKSGSIFFSWTAPRSWPPVTGRLTASRRESAKRYLSRLEALGIENWQNEYINYHILDGTGWELEYKTEAHELKKCTGINEFPETWKEFNVIMDKLKKVVSRQIAVTNKADL
ncbi:MAG: hypothetical protein J6M64_03360 [Oscillospiraceae bacterium]|nr:hypothetical protein [Oscillospiraceae bacterium]